MATEGSNAGKLVLGVAAAGAAAVAVSKLASSFGNLTTGAISGDSKLAAAFLNRATFGAGDASVAALATSGTDAWFKAQATAAPTAGGAPGYWSATPSFHLNWIIRRTADFQADYKAAIAAAAAAAAPGTTPAKVNLRKVTNLQFQESFWARAVTGDDQLRHRMTLALSEIMVVSFAGSTITPRIGASWYDMLSAHAFGNYLDLMKAITLHPAMGIYLNIIGNQQADNDPSREPDENYAREIMQLMSIGLYRLNPDGTAKTDASGAPVPTYAHADIAGLAATFTGWGWYNAKPTAATFAKQPGDGTDASSPDVQPLIGYPVYHSQLSKTFLGMTIPAYAGASPTTAAGASALAAYQLQGLNTALNTIFNHPNVGPFIGYRLIQRLVTSNPSPAYVGRVAAAFNGVATGVRGDLLATLKAVLTDAEALNLTPSASPTAGKLKEPVIRMSHWLRASNATSTMAASTPGGNFNQYQDFVAPTALAQAPLEAPSVFNFWAPDYTPQGSSIAKAGLVVPEFQAVDVLTVAGYANTMIQVIQNKGWPGNDVVTTYAQEIAALTPANASDPDTNQTLIDRLNLLYFGGQMSSTMSARLSRVLTGTVSTAKAPTAAQRAQVRLDKVRNALILVLTSPEYLVQG
ncbi:MAG TPA: DUF1800 family protein [Phenylobacterium sp.]|jgi:uncharacterized protein (DUF1800 family)|uniref:DUF1800 domain-containing protein n=1 Tax=Phenylobacterium sp. TaxID=1871053 RepID=UPI002BBA2D98|nr:DUF1800 family protein [Phenylobacterium sp.]HXA39043.1 DUF1800 family protein [Phenylobacterium sp.]